MTDVRQALLDEAEQLFGRTPRPEHFTNHQHCCECAEHDETLRARDTDSLSLDDVSPAWDPFCFINLQGFRYYFPALVRLALQEADEDYFVDQFLFHLSWDGDDNERYRSFSDEERAFVAAVLTHLLEQRADQVERHLDAENLLRTLAIWRQQDNFKE